MAAFWRSVGKAYADRTTSRQLAVVVLVATGVAGEMTAVLALLVGIADRVRIAQGSAVGVINTLLAVSIGSSAHALLAGVAAVGGTTSGRNAASDANVWVNRGVANRVREPGRVAIAVLVACRRVGIRAVAEAAEEGSLANPAGLASRRARLSTPVDALSALANGVGGAVCVGSACRKMLAFGLAPGA